MTQYDESILEISEVLKRIPEAKLRDATNHLIGVINGMAMANEMMKPGIEGGTYDHCI